MAATASRHETIVVGPLELVPDEHLARQAAAR
jgi:hypothetical protein